MFTGIVQGLGSVQRIVKTQSECRFTFLPLFVFGEFVNGESIAVNGACLSVENHTDKTFSAYASTETMYRTNLAFLREGARVNLERALAFGERLGGHLVSGHVDCLATVTAVEKAGQSVRIRLEFPGIFAPQVLEKGSVALNGISLTINDCGRNFLEVNVIPDSQKRTNILSWKPGDKINMETDLIGKYIQNIMRYDLPGDKEIEKKDGINRDFLSRNGFI